MEKIQSIITFLATGIPLLITTLTFLAKFLSNAKAKKAAEDIITIGNAVLPYIEQAETFLNYSGIEKKEYVITKANQFAIEKGIKFNDGMVSSKIEELVSLTKKVNKREKQEQVS